MTTTSLTYKPMSLAEIGALPTWTILSKTWPHDPEPELYRRSASKSELSWDALGEAVDYGTLERMSAKDIHSEYALYAVIYQPAETA